ncbi:chemotaxis protein CheD [Cytophagales bacterium WSM2-2]|nr:chemotaxis protein CheD [Cytophagales bacterium WSM2-2]
MIEYKLNIGEVATSAGKASYSCFGLGSCIGLFIKDNLTGYTGGAHIFLPDDEAANGYFPFSGVTQALDEILRQLKAHGSNLMALRAKLAGGANFLGTESKVGEQNIQSVLRNLISRRIFVAATDLGGNFSRTTKFNSDTGVLTVSIPEMNQSKTY